MKPGLLRIEYIERLENMNTIIYEALAKYKKMIHYHIQSILV